MDINVFPVNQAFPPALSGGTVVPTPVDVRVAPQAFRPAPLAYPFPSEPTPPKTPFYPVLQGVPPVPVLSSPIPPAIDVSPADQSIQAANVQTFTVYETGSYATNPAEALVHYTIADVVDYDTGHPASDASVNVLVLLAPTGVPLTSYGVSFAGRVAQFAVVPTSADRTISAYGANDITVPVTVGGARYLPVVGDLVTIAGQTYHVTVVVDAVTLLPPTIVSAAVKVTTDNGSAFPSLVGQNAHFVVVVTSITRPILLYGAYAVIVSIKGADGGVFLPVAGDDFAVDTARYNAELVAQLTGQVQNVIPSTAPLLDELGESASLLPVLDVDVSAQADIFSRPVNVLPYPNRF